MGCVLTFCKRTQASLDLFADALEVTEEAVQSGDKTDSLEVTIALEIVSHFPPGLGGFKKAKPRFDITRTKSAPAQICATKILI